MIAAAPKVVYFVFHTRFLQINESVFLQPCYLFFKTQLFCLLNFKALKGKMPFTAIRFAVELIHSSTSLSIQITAALQVKMTDNSTRYKPKITNIHPTRIPYIGKNQCQSEGALLSLTAFSVMFGNFLSSMIHALHCIKNKTWQSTQNKPYFSFCLLFSCLMKTYCGIIYVWARQKEKTASKLHLSSGTGLCGGRGVIWSSLQCDITVNYIAVA